MFRNLILLTCVSTAVALSSLVTVGTFEWIPFGDDTNAIFKVTPYSGEPSDDVLDVVRLENLRLVLHVWDSTGSVDLGLRAFTLYPGFAAADAVAPAGEVGDPNYSAFPRVTTQPPAAIDDNNRYSRRFLIPGAGGLRITSAWLDYSASAVLPQSTWTLSTGEEFIPNLNVVSAQIGDGTSFFSHSGSPLLVNLSVEGVVVPEPSSIALALSGIAALALRRRFAR